MYLQFPDRYHFVPYLSHWLGLILQLKVLLAYVFKIVSGLWLIFLRCILKHYQGWVPQTGMCASVSSSATPLMDVYLPEIAGVS